MVDLVVVGGGVVGAPAAYFAAGQGAEVVVVASPEPSDRARHEGVFGAHYDQTRLLWRLHPDPVSTRLAVRSVAALRELELETGAGLTRPVGVLYLADSNTESLRATATAPVEFGIEDLTGAEVRARWSVLDVSEDARGYFEPAPAGVVDPREMVSRYLRHSGARVVPAEAVGVEVSAGGCAVTTADGHTINSARVLLAAGAFTNRPGLVERPLRLRLKTETVVFAEIESEQAARYSSLPALHYDLQPGEVGEIYTVPAVPGGEGGWRLKLGANTRRDRWLAGWEAAKAWYRQPSTGADLRPLRAAMLRLYPQLDCRVWRTEHCVITYTAHGHPYIDCLAPGRLYVATGGNGGSAKLGPALGEVAAGLALNDEWGSELDPDWFRVVYADQEIPWRGRELLADRA